MYQVFYRALTNISCGKRRRRRQPETSRANNGDDSNAADKSQSLPLLYGLSRSWAWNAITFRCQTHPQEVSELFADELGETILHWACLGKPPVESIQAILNICPQMAQSRNKAGHLPLHVAISYRASADVLRSLLEAYPKSAKLPNGAGSYPVHLLCDYGSSIESLKMLLQTNEGTSTIALTDRTTGLTPLYVLNARKNGPQWRRTVARVREARNRQPTNSDERKCGLKEQKNDFWRKASFLTFVEYTREPLSAMHMEPGDKNDNDTYGSMLHACAGLSHCPTSLLEFAILIHTPEELQAKKDKDGRLALHVAAATHASALLSRNVDEQRLADGAKQDRSEEALLRILRACPQAAFVFDNNGELPFTLALRVQQQWREKFWRETTVATHAGSYWSKGGLQRLLATNPPALETLNLDERLYPYIWANRLDNAVDELYRSIRRHPNLVQSSRNSSPAAYCCPFRAGPVTIEA